MTSETLDVETTCEYRKAAAPNADDGTVHLVARVFLQRGRIKRSAGEFVCSPSRGKNVRHTRPASRDEFITEPCVACVEQAEKLGLELGRMWQHIPGERVVFYTTSPERRDRPYAERSPKPVGNYMGLEVYKVRVPEDMSEVTRKWFHRDLYHSWDEQMWLALVGAGRAEKY